MCVNARMPARRGGVLSEWVPIAGRKQAAVSAAWRMRVLWTERVRLRHRDPERTVSSNGHAIMRTNKPCPQNSSAASIVKVIALGTVHSSGARSGSRHRVSNDLHGEALRKCGVLPARKVAARDRVLRTPEAVAGVRDQARGMAEARGIRGSALRRVVRQQRTPHDTPWGVFSFLQ